MQKPLTRLPEQRTAPPGPHCDLHPVQVEIYRKMSPTEKLCASIRLRQEAWNLKAAWLQQQNPTWTAEQVQEETKRIFSNA